MDHPSIKFAVCVADSEPDLEHRKVYRVLPDAQAATEDHLRVIDESGEDYLYPANYFVLIDLSQADETALMQAF
ncbi:MAG: hypothetical protein ACE5Q6_00075 [Dehalococcoidia bacterium]